MKSKISGVVIIMMMAISASGQWSIDSLSTAGVYPYSAATLNKAVFTNGGNWDIFDATTNIHTSGLLSISRPQVRVVSFGEKVYLGGGKYGNFADPQYSKNVDVYNATTNTWSTLFLTKNREVGGAGAAGDKIVFAGGTGRSDISGPVYMYSTADIFDVNTGVRTSGKLSKARSNIAVGASGNKIVFAGGWFWDMSYNTISSNTVDIYDVSTGLWTKTTLSLKRENIAVAVISSKIIFAGGTGGNLGGAVKNVDIYDASADSWTTSNLPTARYSMKSVVIGTNAYFAGGAYDPAENEVDIYNTVANSWSTIYMPTALSGYSMSVINDKIYFAGGYITATATYSNLIQIYDPATATWTFDYLSLGRNNIKALTCGNKGYFAGGYIAYGYPIPVSTKRIDLLGTLSPVADFIASATNIFAGGTVNFTDLSTNIPTAWSWTFNGGTPSTSIIQNPSVQYNTAGTYDVTLTSINAVGSSTITKTAFITVNPAPCLMPDGLTTTNITTTAATFNWNAVSGALKYKVSYKLTGNNPWITTTVTNNFIQFTGLSANTTYNWKVKTICSNNPTISSDFSSSVSFTTSLNKMATTMSGNSFEVYPNPVTNELNISVNSMQLPLTCLIYDLYGRMAKATQLTEPMQIINVTDLASGNYLILIVTNDNQRMSAKFIKQ
ncbi:MAG: PKD domain-containing protein [Chitinophagales bacterium]